MRPGTINGPWLVDLAVPLREKLVRQTFRIATPGAEAEGAALDRSATASDTVASARTTVPGESAACLRGIVSPSGGEFVLHLTVIVQEPTACTSKN
jgi:hypothetical protein